MKNPLGLVKSGDWGKTLTSLGFEGAIDFHLPSPPLGAKDAIAYLTVNPNTPSEIVFGTFERNLHMTRDLGKSWTAIAERGKTLVNP